MRPPQAKNGNQMRRRRRMKRRSRRSRRMQTHMSNPHTRLSWLFSDVIVKKKVEIIGCFSPSNMEYSSIATFSVMNENMKGGCTWL